MSTIDDFVRTRSAFEKPTLTLLRRKWASVVVAVFTTVFPREHRRIPADQFHALVTTCLEDLMLYGEDVPEGSVRDLCRDWVTQRWLILAPSEDATEEYSLTSHAQEAIDVVRRLSSERTARFGESRVQTILDTARRCAIDASPDRARRVRLLSEQIDELTRERDRIASGGTVETASDEQMLDKFLNLQGLLSELPRDFLRVTESVKGMHRQVITDFRAEDGRTGEIIDAYLDRAEKLMGGSAEGRAFTGAVALLRNEDMLAQLRADIEAILSHDFAESLLPAEQTSLRRTAAAINSGIDTVLQERRRLSATLQSHITRHDPLRDRELDEALRVVAEQMQTWSENASVRAKVPLSLDLNRVRTEHLRTRLYDPDEHAPPPPLATPVPASEDGSFDDIRSQGGPALSVLRERVDSALDGRDEVSIGEVFAALPTEQRRPVDVLGLLHLGASSGAQESGDDVEFETVRPDGTGRVLVASGQVFRKHSPSSTTEPKDTPG